MFFVIGVDICTSQAFISSFQSGNSIFLVNFFNNKIVLIQIILMSMPGKILKKYRSEWHEFG